MSQTTTLPVNIPVNIITGFLGAGKTTAIRHLLRTKPQEEKWAVLVNEFGEVGIDGEVFNTDGIAVKEVAGGCICCSVRLPSQQALLQLIEQQQPDRLVIEPTGLALPKQIFDMLSTTMFVDLLDIRATICLVDPWCFSDESFIGLPTFAAQISMSDYVVATKADVASPEHINAFNEYASQFTNTEKRFHIIEQGKLDWHLLQQPRQANGNMPESLSAKYPQTHNLPPKDEATPVHYDESGVSRLQNRNQIGFSCGWQFTDQWQFNQTQLLTLFEQCDVPRIKGIFATSDGWILINKMRQTVSTEILDSATNSKVEMINMIETDWDALDRAIRECGRTKAEIEVEKGAK